MDAKISIVVPIFNVEKYLKRCLDSIVKQTYSNIEVILVDDGSTDSSSSWVREYESKYGYVKAIYKENGGLSSARNVGLEAATGEYILFVDSDDFIKEDAVEKLYTKALERNAEVVIGTFTNYYEDHSTQQSKYNYNESSCVDKNSALEMLLLDKFSSAAWDKLFKREVFINNNIRFPEGKLFEDVPTIVNLLFYVERVAFLNESFYFYFKREGSITNSINLKSLDDHINVMELIDESKISKLGFMRQYEVFLINHLFVNYGYLIKSDRISKIEKNTYLKNKFRSHLNKVHFNNCLFNQHLTSKNKIKLLLMKLNLNVLLKWYLTNI